MIQPAFLSTIHTHQWLHWTWGWTGCYRTCVWSCSSRPPSPLQTPLWIVSAEGEGLSPRLSVNSNTIYYTLTQNTCILFYNTSFIQNGHLFPAYLRNSSFSTYMYHMSIIYSQFSNINFVCAYNYTENVLMFCL